MDREKLIGFAKEIINLCEINNEALDEIIKERKVENPHVFTACNRFKLNNQEEIDYFNDMIRKIEYKAF